MIGEGAAADAAASPGRPLDRYLAVPRCPPPLDAEFRPVALARRRFETLADGSGDAVPVVLAVEQPGGPVAVRRTVVLPDGHREAAAGHAMCERLVKTLLWGHGGARVWVDGPAGLIAALRVHYATTAAGRFDALTLGDAVYGRTFEVVAAAAASFPADRGSGAALGGHLDGCRIGFDLGASARRSAALVDGEVVFSEEVAWDPTSHADPQWHHDQIMDSLRRAAAHLPRVDAIGGSSAGVYIDGRARVASLFRSVPPGAPRQRVADLFEEIRTAWGGIPLVVMNDGDVAALAGALRAGTGRLLGVAMGSSEAAGYVTAERTLSARLSELAFVPLDLAPGAPLDDWSADRGCGVEYLSQRAVARLIPRAGIEVDPAMPLPSHLRHLRRLMADADPRARAVYETIGVYLGYALLEYRILYDMAHVLLLGGVVAGSGGDVIASAAREVLRVEDPGGEPPTFHALSERTQRHAQAVAAASLPRLVRQA